LRVRASLTQEYIKCFLLLGRGKPEALEIYNTQIIFRNVRLKNNYASFPDDTGGCFSISWKV
jgi:hypothetical protein